MQDEVYDVFDMQGNKVGTATWTECHSKGLVHRTVSALVFKDDTKREMLIQRRSLQMTQSPGTW